MSSFGAMAMVFRFVRPEKEKFNWMDNQIRAMKMNSLYQTENKISNNFSPWWKKSNQIDIWISTFSVESFAIYLISPPLFYASSVISFYCRYCTHNHLKYLNVKKLAFVCIYFWRRNITYIQTWSVFDELKHHKSRIFKFRTMPDKCFTTEYKYHRRFSKIPTLEIRIRNAIESKINIKNYLHFYLLRLSNPSFKSIKRIFQPINNGIYLLRRNFTFTYLFSVNALIQNWMTTGAVYRVLCTCTQYVHSTICTQNISFEAITKIELHWTWKRSISFWFSHWTNSLVDITHYWNWIEAETKRAHVNASSIFVGRCGEWI